MSEEQRQANKERMATHYIGQYRSRVESSFAAPDCSAAPGSKATELREAFAAMEQEQWDEYQDYLKRCGGVPISKIKASRPVRKNSD